MAHDDSENEIVVSVCCIAFNHADYIRDAMDGFLAQNCNFFFEILVHDDASTDGTLEILLDYERRFPNVVKVFAEEENQYGKNKYKGGYFSFLEGFARGKYIAFCEGDDYWCDPGKLQSQVDYFEAHPECAETCHSAKVVDGVSGHCLGIMGMGDIPCDIRMADLLRKWSIPTASRMFRRDISKGYLDFKEQIPKAPVGDFPRAIYSATKGYIHYEPQCMSIYRFRTPGSWTAGIVGWKRQVDNSSNWLEMLGSIDEVTSGCCHSQIVDACVPHVRKIEAYQGISLRQTGLAGEAVRRFTVIDWAKLILSRMLFKLGFAFQMEGYGESASRHIVRCR